MNTMITIVIVMQMQLFHVYAYQLWFQASQKIKNIYKFMLFTTNLFVANLLKYLRSCQFTSMKRQLSKPVITFLLIALQPRLYAYKRQAKRHHSSKRSSQQKKVTIAAKGRHSRKRLPQQQKVVIVEKGRHSSKRSPK